MNGTMVTKTGIEAVKTMLLWQYSNVPDVHNAWVYKYEPRPLLVVKALRYSEQPDTVLEITRTGAQYRGYGVEHNSQNMGLTRIYQGYDYRGHNYGTYCIPLNPGPLHRYGDTLISVSFEARFLPDYTRDLSGIRHAGLAWKVIKYWETLDQLPDPYAGKHVIPIDERDEYSYFHIVLKNDVGVASTDRPLGTHYPAGTKLAVMDIWYPGKQLPHTVYEEWGFWDCFDIDLAYYFHAEDVAEIIVPGTDRWRRFFEDNKPPFKVTFI